MDSSNKWYDMVFVSLEEKRIYCCPLAKDCLLGCWLPHTFWLHMEVPAGSQNVPHWEIWESSKATGTRCSRNKVLSGYTWIKVVARSVWYTVLDKSLLFFFLLFSSQLMQARGHVHTLSATRWSWSLCWHRTRFPNNLRATRSVLYCVSAPTSDKLHTQQSILSPSPVDFSSWPPGLLCLLNPSFLTYKIGSCACKESGIIELFPWLEERVFQRCLQGGTMDGLSQKQMG